MADLISVVGFFYVEGSRDYPNNMGLNQNFGFDLDLNGDLLPDPVFNYSVNDIENAFSIPRKLSRPSAHQINVQNSIKEIDSLIVESGNNPAIITQDVANTAWGEVFKILETVYMFQATVSNVGDPHDDVNYDSKGDEILAYPASLYYVPSYEPGSLNLHISTISSGSTRLDYIDFIANIGTEGSPQKVTFKVYMVPDTMIATISTGNLSVYVYEDPSEDNEIDRVEFQTEIMDKVFAIMSSKNFKQYKIYPVDKHIQIDGGGETILPQDFYVFSTFATTFTISDDMLKGAVKSYLIGKYSSNYETLGKLYPDLFASDIVHIHALTSNERPSGAETVVANPLDLLTLHNFLQSRGYEFDPFVSGGGLTAYPTEIFYIGAENGDTLNPTNMIFPLVAIEETTASDTYPITSRFVDYRPVYSTGYTPTSDEWKLFHHLLLIALKNVVKGIELPDTMIEGVLFETVMKIADDTKIDYIKFVYKGTNWYVYAPASV